MVAQNGFAHTAANIVALALGGLTAAGGGALRGRTVRVNREIAERLFVTEATVESHINRLFAKAGVRDRAQAVRYPYQHSLADRPAQGRRGDRGGRTGRRRRRGRARTGRSGRLQLQLVTATIRGCSGSALATVTFPFREGLGHPL
ncbi:hypothetical protein BJY16_002714 [Actinoplanes octamycinicus]|uniref:HTH luxR-type domain-containing protein n=1 Tax=Actinoplanes octamycinicus TaxID=135948 RepID=A0A7W7GVW1_9ACTN|nr:helix-turn-helix transcriptional regulator [Actinoplanes octamycinicus]MBB4739255.1 hypothetical protein [Actinoplanes octamycinicus]GIE58769.1 hypothetical protein Aoc01nite_41710 [Actinoplanes octamycinicus]